MLPDMYSMSVVHFADTLIKMFARYVDDSSNIVFLLKHYYNINVISRR